LGEAVTDQLTIHTVGVVLESGLLAWLAALILLIAFRLMTGEIRLDGLLSHSADTSSGLPERMTVAVATLGYALYYAGTALHTPLDAMHPSLPDVPDSILTVLFGINGLYLTSKIANLRANSGD
jgi:hypothetical protein